MFGRRGAPTWTAAEQGSRRRSGRERGATIAEVLLVGLFLVGLVFVASWGIDGIRSDTASTNCETSLRTLKLATERYHAENDAYPADQTVLVDLGFADAEEIEGWSLSLGDDVKPAYEGTGPCA